MREQRRCFGSVFQFKVKDKKVSETEVSCCTRPPTVHSEGHSLLFSCSPVINSVPSLYLPFFFFPFLSFIVFGGKDNQVCKKKMEQERSNGSRSAGQLEEQRAAVALTLCA